MDAASAAALGHGNSGAVTRADACGGWAAVTATRPVASRSSEQDEEGGGGVGSRRRRRKAAEPPELNGGACEHWAAHGAYLDLLWWF